MASKVVLSNDRKRRSSSSNACREAGSSTPGIVRAATPAFSVSFIVSSAVGFRAGWRRGIGFEIQGYEERIDSGVAFAVLQCFVEQSLGGVQPVIDFHQHRLKTSQLTGREKNTRHQQGCREGRQNQ